MELSGDAHRLLTGADTYDIEKFLEIVFPPEWSGIAARIIESGVQMSPTSCKWAPRWSQIPPTKRKGFHAWESKLKSIIFRVHDCLHQLWGLPHPGNLTKDNFYYYKRSQMCGEVAVLTLTEFVYCRWLYDTFPEFRDLIWGRNAVPMLVGPLKGKTATQVAARLDDLLHKKSRPKWVRENVNATEFVEDYVPMLEYDREVIDKCWKVFLDNPSWVSCLDNAPKARFGRQLDGLELTLWMIEDFEHLLSSEPDVDWALTKFNRSRRSNVILPKEWPC